MADRGLFHRDEDAPAIPVAELLAAHKRIRSEPEEQVFVDELLQREEPARQPRQPRQGRSARSGSGPRAPQPLLATAPSPNRHTPRVLGVAATVAVLTGALVVAQSLTHRADQQPPTVEAASGPTHITGYKVFKPDIIRASINDQGGDAASQGNGAGQAGAGAGAGAAQQPGQQAGQPQGQPQGGAGQQPGAAGSAGQAGSVGTGGTPGSVGGALPGAGSGAPAQTGAPAAPAQPRPPAQQPAPTTTSSRGGGLLDPILDPLDPITGPILGPILGFYSAAPSRPGTAYEYLDPAVQGGSVEDFTRSWTGVTGAVVEGARPDGPDAMVVQVSLMRLDGIRLTTQQRIVVSQGTAKPKIVDAQLLSAWLSFG